MQARGGGEGWKWGFELSEGAVARILWLRPSWLRFLQLAGTGFRVAGRTVVHQTGRAACLRARLFGAWERGQQLRKERMR